MYYYKINNDGFVEFYIQGINEITEDMNKISKEKYFELTTGNSLGGEIRELKDKSIGLFFKPPLPKNSIKMIFNYQSEAWEETATLEEQIEHYKNLIIQKTKEIETEKLAGFRNSNFELELNELKKIHLEKSHELALQIENRLRKKK